MMDLWEVEREYRSRGYKTICGVDEAGRGPLAGPVYAAAVVLPFNIEIPNLNDSKKLTESVRDKLYDFITCHAVAYSVAFVTHAEIDEINILQATYLAMNKALEELTATPMQSPFLALIDGNRNDGINYNSVCIVGGDGKSASIAAASILAKVNRDRHMIKMAELYPQYEFEKHKGYGTKLHYEKLQQYGVSEIHRTTFLKKLGKNK